MMFSSHKEKGIEQNLHKTEVINDPLGQFLENFIFA